MHVLDLLIDCVHCDPVSFCLHCTLESLFYFCLTCILYNMHEDTVGISSAGVVPHLLFIQQARTNAMYGWKWEQIPRKAWPGPCLALDTCDGVHLEVGWRSHACCKLLCRLNTDTHAGPLRHSCGIVDAQGQNRACDILNQSEGNP